MLAASNGVSRLPKDNKGYQMNLVSTAIAAGFDICRAVVVEPS